MGNQLKSFLEYPEPKLKTRKYEIGSGKGLIASMKRENWKLQTFSHYFLNYFFFFSCKRSGKYEGNQLKSFLEYPEPKLKTRKCEIGSGKRLIASKKYRNDAHNFHILMHNGLVPPMCYLQSGTVCDVSLGTYRTDCTESMIIKGLFLGPMSDFRFS